MKMKQTKTIDGKVHTFLIAGKVKGKNYFLKNGYSHCKNPRYLNKDNSYVHYNSILKAWIIETA